VPKVAKPKAAKVPGPKEPGTPAPATATLPIPTKDDSEFVADMARFAEGNASEADIKRKYRFGDEVWARLGEDDELVRTIEAEKVRRVRSGQQKRERAQALVVKAPDVLAGILMDDGANPRHRIDSAKELNAFAGGGPTEAAAQDRFIITINLGTDSSGRPVIEHFDKPLAAIDVSPNKREEIEW
jgi:hypothetical protein